MNKILIDLYDGDYGRTLIIMVNSVECLQKIKAFFVLLSRKEAEFFSFSDCNFVKTKNSFNLIVKVKDDENIKLINNNIVWTQIPEKWDFCAELIQGLLNKGIAGHQYLLETPDLIVELSYKENPHFFGDEREKG